MVRFVETTECSDEKLFVFSQAQYGGLRDDGPRFTVQAGREPIEPANGKFPLSTLEIAKLLPRRSDLVGESSQRQAGSQSKFPESIGQLNPPRTEKLIFGVHFTHILIK